RQPGLEHHHSEALHVSPDGDIGHYEEVGGGVQELEIALGHASKRTYAMRNVPASGGRKDVFRFGALAGQPVVDIVGKEREDLIHEPHKTLPLDLAPDATKEKAGFRLPVAPHLLEERSTTFLPIAPHRLEPTERDTEIGRASCRERV